MLGHVTYVLAAVVVFLGTRCSSSLTVKSMLLRSHIRYRFATTVVTSTVVNDDVSGSKEALFEVVLPEEAFIANFSMTVDGEIYPGEVKEKKAAMAKYQEAKSRGQSAGYIKTTARNSNKFDVSVNLKSGSTVTFNLTYQQLLARCHGMYEHKMHVNPGRVVPDLKVEVFIEESRPITKLEKSLKIGLEENKLSEEDARVENPSSHSRYIVYNPTADRQGKGGDSGISGELVIKYDVERTSSVGEVLVVDGYFLHFFAPENSGDLTPVPKDIVFILDISGSMSGQKIAQLRDAMTTILQELSSDDTFNIFSFNDELFRWQETMLSVTSENIGHALEYVNRLGADGSTDINSALVGGVEFLLNQRDRNHIPLIFFLTDGQPTSGVKNSGIIANNVERNNEGVASVIGLAFGEGADYNLVKIVSVQNNGIARKIYEAADASQQVKGFYDEIANTMLQNLTIKYINGTVQEDTVTSTFFRNVYKGTDVVVAGRIAQDSSRTNKINGVVTAETNKGTINLILDNDTEGIFLPPDPKDNPYFHMPVDFASVAEKSWAYLTIKDLLKQKKKVAYKEKQEGQDIDKQILALSLKYKFVTPLTSMVATKPDAKESQASLEGDEYGSNKGDRRQSSRKSYMPKRKRISPVGSAGFPGHSFPYSSNVYHSRSSRRRSRPQSQPQYQDPDLPQFHGSHQVQDFYQYNLHFQTKSAAQIQPTFSAVKARKYKGKTAGKKLTKKAKRNRKNKRTCRLVRIGLEGFGITTSRVTKCVKVRKIQAGTFQIYPKQFTNLTDFAVQATFVQGKRKKNLDEITIMFDKQNITFNLTFDQNNVNSTTWKSPDNTMGHVTIHKHVTCRGRRGIAKIFVNVHLPDQQPGPGGKIKRDVKGRIRNKSKKSKKPSPLLQSCKGPLKKESLYSKSDRFVADRSLHLYAQTVRL